MLMKNEKKHNDFTNEQLKNLYESDFQNALYFLLNSKYSEVAMGLSGLSLE